MSQDFVKKIQEAYSSPEVSNYLPMYDDVMINGRTSDIVDESGALIVHPVPGVKAEVRAAHAAVQGSQNGPVSGPDGGSALPGQAEGESALTGRTGGATAVVAVPLTRNPLEGTRGKRMVLVAHPKDTDPEEFRKVISGCYRTWLQQGTLDPTTIAEKTGLTVERVSFYLSQDETGYALAVRGIDTQGTSLLSPEQDNALMVLSDTTSRKSFNARMRDAGINQAKLLAWRKNPTFERAYTGIVETIAQQYEPAMLELARRAGDGDIRAIEKSLEISGRYNPNTQGTIDVLVVINRVTEILAKHLSDQPEVLRAISGDLSAVGQEVQQHANRQLGRFGL